MSWGGQKETKVKVNSRVIGVATDVTRKIGSTRYRVVSLDGETSESHLWNARTPWQVSKAYDRHNNFSHKPLVKDDNPTDFVLEQLNYSILGILTIL